MKKTKFLLDKRDYRRALLSDTLPSDSPIIYSNQGLYINCHRSVKPDLKSVLDLIVVDLYRAIISPIEKGKKYKKSYPLKYKIMKNDIDYRNLSLTHPRSQYNFSEFYRDHADLITYLCSKSEFSIRSPRKIAGAMYVFNVDVESKYREINIDTLESEIRNKYADSFFAYKGFRRLHQFYDSLEYLELEKRFPKMWNLDVSNCFDSVYTHTVAWASKNKSYSQKNTSNGIQVVGVLDQLMQRSNSNETNGIPIGAETSRIFAEIIFQNIDQNIVTALKKTKDLTFDKDYVILRYVDDFIIFGKNEFDLGVIYQTIAACLYEYKFSLNKEKISKTERPFSTTHSNIVTELNIIIKEFDEKIFSKNDESNLEIGQKIIGIRYKNKVFKSFINQIKVLIADQSGGYSYVSSYLISALARKVTILIQTYGGEEAPIIEDIKGNLLVITRLAFFFYSVCPGIPASQKLARIIGVIDQFFNNHGIDHIPEIRTEIMFLIEGLANENIGSIETLNIVLSSANFGRNYLVSNSWFDQIVNGDTKPNYFTIISLLYYFKDYERYSIHKEKIEKTIMYKLFENQNFIENLTNDSESAHLFLDILSCPYASIKLRSRMLNKFYRFTQSSNSISRSSKAFKETLEELLTTYWFVNWNEIDLLKLLERKELREAY